MRQAASVTQARRGGNGTKAAMRAGGGKAARPVFEQAGQAVQRGVASVARAERQAVTRAQRAGRDAMRGLRRHPVAAASVAMAGLGLAYFLARLARRG
ncbi:MAG: hypothetical protein ACOY37_12930 [Pseudomonadota bacterium]